MDIHDDVHILSNYVWFLMFLFLRDTLSNVPKYSSFCAYEVNLLQI